MSRKIFKGFVKVSRDDFFYNKALQTIERRSIYLSMRMMASWRDSDKCKIGELITSQHEIAKMSLTNRDKVRHAIKAFEKEGLIKVETDALGTKISILDMLQKSEPENQENRAQFAPGPRAECANHTAQDKPNDSNEMDTIHELPNAQAVDQKRQDRAILEELRMIDDYIMSDTNHQNVTEYNPPNVSDDEHNYFNPSLFDPRTTAYLDQMQIPRADHPTIMQNIKRLRFDPRRFYECAASVIRQMEKIAILHPTKYLIKSMENFAAKGTYRKV